MIVDGKLVAQSLKNRIIDKLLNDEKVVCFVIFGNDPSSRQFISMKCRFAEGLGIKTIVEEHSDTVNIDQVKSILNNIISKNYSGIVVQLPLPKNLNTEDVLNLIPTQMDIDVLSDRAKIEYKNSLSNMIPPVSRAIDEILKFYNIELSNKKILVIGNGRLVGEPVANMLLQRNIYFRQLDKSTPEEEKKRLILDSDIIISGAGDSHFIKPSMIKSGVVLIDAGTSEQEGKIVGDVDPACFDKAALVTPVPGGVGPVTLACLFLNLSH